MRRDASAVDDRTERNGVPRRLKVLIVSQPTSYGVAVYVRQLTEAAVAAGHDVVVVSPGPGRGPLAGWIADAGAGHAVVDLSRSPALRDLPDLWAIRRLARDVDVVHLHSSKACALGRVAAMSLGRARPRIVMTPHYWSWLVGGRLAGLYRWVERLLARWCDAIVAVSEREAIEGRRVLGRAAGHLMVIHNGVDRDRFSPHGPRADRSPSPLILCVGRLSEQKGQDVAIRALARVQDRAARLRLVGDDTNGGERRRLEALAAALGVSDRIEWRGHVDDTAPEFRAADVVVAPSRWEGMSLAFLESMACGAAMVVTDVPGSEVVDGVGVIVPPDDPEALADAVDALLSDPVRRRELGEAARRRSASYDVATALRRNLALWATLTGDRTVPAGRRPITSERGTGLLLDDGGEIAGT